MSEKTNNNLDLNKEVLDLTTAVQTLIKQVQNQANDIEQLKKVKQFDVKDFFKGIKDKEIANPFEISERLKERYKKYLLTKVANPELLENEEFLAAVDGVCSTFTPELVLVICLTMRHGSPLEDVLG